MTNLNAYSGNAGWLFYKGYYKDIDWPKDADKEANKKKLEANKKKFMAANSSLKAVHFNPAELQPQPGKQTLRMKTAYPGLLMGTGHPP
jgi:hypothetical protein